MTIPDSPPWLAVALQEYGVHETRGGETPRIMAYHRAAADGQDEDEDAWCSAFLCWTMEQCGTPHTHSGAARSWLTWGVESPPRFGAVVVFWRGSPDGWQGHVGILVASRGGDLYVLAGNQGNAVSISPMPRSRVLGYRWAAA
jgi:uncharacterized protein (TIGR02594 family)